MAQSAASSSPSQSSGSVGDLLRHWRSVRGISQLDLALTLGVSQRHVSFIESGRSGASRALLLGLAQALDIPLRERNALLLVAGFAPMYAEPAWDAAEMRMINRALDRMLRQHAPFPALVLDRYWNVLTASESAAVFFGGFVDLAKYPKPRNLLRLVFDVNGLRPFIQNWHEVAVSLFQRIQREAVAGALDEPTRELIAELRASAGIEGVDASASVSLTSPVVPIVFCKDGQTSRWFSMVATVGTPQFVAAQELRLECMFPADEATEAAFGGPANA